MRTILEELPYALLPDLQKESDDPGVVSELLDDDLVRPAAEEELPRHSARGRKSPLSRHVVHVVDPLDRALPLPVGLQLSLEGARVTEVVVAGGFTHQGLERRCLGKSVVDAALWRVVARAEPGVVTVFALARALERLSGQAPSAATTQQRRLALDLVTIKESARVLAQPALGADVSGKVDDARAAARAAAALVEGFVAGDVFYAPLRLRRRIASEERAAILQRLDDVERAWSRIAPLSRFGHLEGKGVLDAAACRRLGVTGPALRAAGAVDDEPTIDLEAATPAATLDRTGDALARLCTRYDDGTAALARLRRGLGGSDGADAADDAGDADFVSKDGIGTAVVRGPGGGCAVLVSVAGGVVERLRIRPPDLALMAALPRALVGVALDDVAAVVASFGIHMSAVDR